MVDKIKKFRLVPFFFIMMLFSSFAFAQVYYIEEDEKGNQTIKQTFSWEQDENVFKYEFIMEHFVKGKWVEIEHVELQTNKVDLSLPSGTYRYKILLYNYLGFLETETDWIPVDIIKAYQPKISAISPGNIYLDEMQDGIFEIDGSELRPETEFSLSKSKKGEEGTIKGKIIEEDKRNKHVKIYFDPELIDTAKYKLVAKNPGGLKDAFDGPLVRYKKPMDFDVSLSYVIPVVLFDETIPNYLGQNVFPLTLNSRASFLPVKSKYGYLGAQINGYYMRMDHDFSNYEVGGNLIMGFANFVYQFPIRKLNSDQKTYRLLATLEAHVGAGVVQFMNYRYIFPGGIQSKPLNSINLSADIGVGGQIYVYKRMFVDINVDFVAGFGKDMVIGMVLPSVGAGWQF
ncbi:MAG: hypothetical protein J6Y36_00890 [Treponema sp.]|uniref:hypothetical protein n=1 Tax=Treponema sp. TaxID=166 RepID=UPI001B7A0F65|nr:hypothetical protein [Treponema sp.]MBP5401692.1 hypothetical protein [Treponema sp.]MBR5933601.1 hypothetical protein [Treponema sp.]